ncbi:hypothetical protein M758_1G008000 [Ceratodon purpureus]|nr:hypothetical protein M758_1G008000 [Ceratodon purpureus]
MNLVTDAAKDVARVATGVGIVVAECTKGVRLQDLGTLAFQSLKNFSRRDTRVGDFASSEAEFQELRERQGSQRRGVAMDGNTGVSQGSEKTAERTGVVQGVVPQPEELFAPTKAAESKEARPFKSPEADADVEPLSQKVALPSVDAHLPTK